MPSCSLSGPPVSVYDIGMVTETRKVPSTTVQPATILRMAYCHAPSESLIRQHTNVKAQNGDSSTSIQPVVAAYITILELNNQKIECE